MIVFNETITRGSDARLTQKTKIRDVVQEWGLMDPIASNGTDLIDLLCTSLSLSFRKLLICCVAHRTGLPRHDGVYAYVPLLSHTSSPTLSLAAGKTKIKTS